MVGKTAPRNKEEQERIDFVKNFMGCLPCLLVNLPNSHANYNHIVSGRKRLGHMFGYGSCAWHDTFHVNWRGRSTQAMIGQLGPSLGHGKKPFEEVFGDERLLSDTVGFAQGLFKEKPWQEFAMPTTIVSKIRTQHINQMYKAA